MGKLGEKLGSRERSHTTFGPYQFSGFDVYWIQTDKQTNNTKTNKVLGFQDASCPSSISTFVTVSVNIFSLYSIKKVCGFHNIFHAFKKFYKIKTFKHNFFEILIIHRPSLRSREVPHKIWAPSVQSLCRLLDTTERQIDRQANNIQR